MVACPSTGRPGNMRRMLEIFPDLHVFVYEAEMDAYGAVVPADQLHAHTLHGNICQIQNWIIEQCQVAFGYRAFLLIDDDLNRIRSNIWARGGRWYNDTATIRQVIDNGFNTLVDLDLPLYTWSGKELLMWYKTTDPFKLNAMAMRAWAMYAPENLGRQFPYRIADGFVTFNDYSMTLEVLLKSRVLIMDRRWYFDFGTAERDVGGLQTLRTKATRSADERLMKERWKGHFNLSGAIPDVVVQRRSPLGHK